MSDSPLKSLSEVKVDSKIEGLFYTMSSDGKEVELQLFIERLHIAGLMDQRDQRLKAMKNIIAEIGGRGKCFYGVKVDLQGFARMVDLNRNLMLRALVDNLVVPNFRDFIQKVDYFYEVQKANVGGQVPEDPCPLETIDPESWSVAVCTIDGQRCFFGDHDTKFPLKGLVKPFLMGFALKNLGIDYIEKFVGHFGTHESCDLLCFDDKRRPINGMVTSGLISLCCMLFGMAKKECIAGKYHEFSEYLNKLTGGEFNQMNTQKVMKEKQEGDRAKSIAHFLKSLNLLPENCSIELGLELYFQSKSIEINCESLSVIAATLANSGINPITGEKVLKQKFVKYVLSLMLSSGMSGYSGKVPVILGQPVKSSSSGGVMLVIPGLMGVAAFCPKLDENKVSMRCLGFLEHFINEMAYHPYQKLSDRLLRKFPSRRVVVTQCNSCCELFSAVVNGNHTGVIRLTENPDNAYVTDSYGRNALHVAVAQGQIEIAKYLCEKFSSLTISKDRWGRKPTNYANATHYQLIAKLREWETLMGERTTDGSGDSRKDRPRKKMSCPS